MKYTLSGKLTVGVYINIEAESEEDAFEKGTKITAHACVGKGASDGLVCIDGPGVAHFCCDDCYPEWTDAEEASS